MAGQRFHGRASLSRTETSPWSCVRDSPGLLAQLESPVVHLFLARCDGFPDGTGGDGRKAGIHV